jgi:hypothetical protein
VEAIAGTGDPTPRYAVIYDFRSTEHTRDAADEA